MIERATKEAEYQVRTLKSAMDDRLGTNTGASSNILAWMIEFSSVLLNRYLVSKDGKTSHERLKGKQSKMLGFELRRRCCSGGSPRQADSGSSRASGRTARSSGIGPQRRVHGDERRRCLQDPHYQKSA